jgi:hypothetical protein
MERQKDAVLNGKTTVIQTFYTLFIYLFGRSLPTPLAVCRQQNAGDFHKTREKNVVSISRPCSAQWTGIIIGHYVPRQKIEPDVLDVNLVRLTETAVEILFSLFLQINIAGYGHCGL